MVEAHRNARNPATGRVNGRKFRKEKGKPWLNLISRQDYNDHVRKIQGRAFRAKAGWVKAADDLGGSKMSGVSHLITRHVSSARGLTSITGKGMDIKVMVSNNVPWIRKLQPTEDIAKAQTDGMKNGLKHMETTTRKAIEKANRSL
jgi:hypothetical protein